MKSEDVLRIAASNGWRKAKHGSAIHQFVPAALLPDVTGGSAFLSMLSQVMSPLDMAMMVERSDTAYEWSLFDDRVKEAIERQPQPSLGEDKQGAKPKKEKKEKKERKPKPDKQEQESDDGSQGEAQDGEESEGDSQGEGEPSGTDEQDSPSGEQDGQGGAGDGEEGDAQPSQEAGDDEGSDAPASPQDEGADDGEGDGSEGEVDGDGDGDDWDWDDADDDFADDGDDSEGDGDLGSSLDEWDDSEAEEGDGKIGEVGGEVKDRGLVGREQFDKAAAKQAKGSGAYGLTSQLVAVDPMKREEMLTRSVKNALQNLTNGIAENAGGFDSRIFLRKLITFQDVTHCETKVDGRPRIGFFADTSPSSASIATAALDLMQAACRIGIKGADVAGWQAFNDHYECDPFHSVMVNGKTGSGLPNNDPAVAAGIFSETGAARLEPMLKRGAHVLLNQLQVAKKAKAKGTPAAKVLADNMVYSESSLRSAVDAGNLGVPVWRSTGAGIYRAALSAAIADRFSGGWAGKNIPMSTDSHRMNFLYECRAFAPEYLFLFSDADTMEMATLAALALPNTKVLLCTYCTVPSTTVSTAQGMRYGVHCLDGKVDGRCFSYSKGHEHSPYSNTARRVNEDIGAKPMLAFSPQSWEDRQWMLGGCDTPGDRNRFMSNRHVMRNALVAAGEKDPLPNVTIKDEPHNTLVQQGARHYGLGTMSGAEIRNSAKSLRNRLFVVPNVDTIESMVFLLERIGSGGLQAMVTAGQSMRVLLEAEKDLRLKESAEWIDGGTWERDRLETLNKGCSLWTSPHRISRGWLFD